MIHLRSDSFFKGFDQSKLFIQTWQHPKALGTVFITHGQAEHSDCYQRLIHGLNHHLPLNFIAWDLRGHGRSDGLRGYAKDFDHYVLDYHCFLETAVQFDFIQKKPCFGLGHSMGGLIQTCSLADKKDHLFKAQVLSSPFFGLTIEVPAWKDLAATVLNQFLPKLTLSNEIEFSTLSRDLNVISEYEKDLYRHDKISAGVFYGVKREFEKMSTRYEKIKLPTFMSISDNDPIVSTKEALHFFNEIKSKNKVLKIIEEGKHELYNDTCREQVFEAVADFIQPFLKINN